MYRYFQNHLQESYKHRKELAYKVLLTNDKNIARNYKVSKTLRLGGREFGGRACYGMEWKTIFPYSIVVIT